MDRGARPVINPPALKGVKGVVKVAAQKLATGSVDGMRWVLEALKKPGPATQRLPFVTAPTQALTKEDLYTRHRDMLYPYPAQPGASALDRALRAAVDRHDSTANTLLNDAIQKDTGCSQDDAMRASANEIWTFAVNNHRKDIQRAVLLLLGKELDQNFRLRDKKEPQYSNRHFNRVMSKFPQFSRKWDKYSNRRITRVMREFPQYSRKWNKPENLNCKATFGGTDDPIECRHLATTVLEHWQRSGGVKTDFGQFKDVAAIKQNMAVDNHGKYDSIMRGAEETHLIHNEGFGKFIAQQFEAMGNKKENNRQILVESTHHSMALGLRIKSKGGKNTYVVQFYDPNSTNNSARSAMGDPKDFEAHGLSRYIRNEGRQRNYYPESQGISMMYVVPSENDRVTDPLRVSDNRVLSSCIKDDKIDTHAMFHLMRGGFAGELRRLKPVLAQHDKAEVLRLLQAIGGDGTPGFNMALQEGHADAVRAFRELLLLVPENARVGLLAAKRADGTPGLLFALAVGHADTVRAFGNLLLLVPKNERAGLLAATTKNGIPGLFFALKYGHAETVGAFGELLPLVPKNKRAGLLAATDENGIPGLACALQNNHGETVTVYLKLLLLLDGDEADTLFSPRAFGGLSETQIDVLYKPAVDEYLDLLLPPPEEFILQQ